MYFCVCSHCGKSFHFGFTPTRPCRLVTTYFTKERADFRSPAMKTEDACSSKIVTVRLISLFLPQKPVSVPRQSLLYFQWKIFRRDKLYSDQQFSSPFSDGIITPMNHVHFHLRLMLYNLDQERPDLFGTGPQMLCPGSRTAHVNTTANERVTYFTDKLCHFQSRYKA